jgi:hypothetical protein
MLLYEQAFEERESKADRMAEHETDDEPNL